MPARFAASCLGWLLTTPAWLPAQLLTAPPGCPSPLCSYALVEATADTVGTCKMYSGLIQVSSAGRCCGRPAVQVEPPSRLRCPVDLHPCKSAAVDSAGGAASPPATLRHLPCCSRWLLLPRRSVTTNLHRCQDGWCSGLRPMRHQRSEEPITFSPFAPHSRKHCCLWASFSVCKEETRALHTAVLSPIAAQHEQQLEGLPCCSSPYSLHHSILCSFLHPAPSFTTCHHHLSFFFFRSSLHLGYGDSKAPPLVTFSLPQLCSRTC